MTNCRQKDGKTVLNRLVCARRVEALMCLGGLLFKSLILSILTSGPVLPLAAHGGGVSRTMHRPLLSANPMAEQLEMRLADLRRKLDRRSRLVDLQSAIEQSLLRNPILAEEYNKIQEQEWNLIAVRRQWYPVVNGGSSGNSFLGYRGSTTKSVNSNQEQFSPITTFSNLVETSPQVQLNWTFFNPSRGASINSASEKLTADRFLFDVKARDLVLDTQLAYFALQEQKQLINDYEVILRSTSKQLTRTEAMFNAGAASISDVEQIRTQQLQNLAKLIDTYRRVVDTAARLAQAMALPIGTLAMPKDQLMILGGWDLSQSETLNQAELMREEIKASLAQASSSGWQAMSFFYNYVPRLSANAIGSFINTNTADGNPGSMITVNRQGAQWNGAVGLGFNWQIFDGGINAAQAEQSKAQARQFKNRADVIRFSIAKEVESAYGNYEASTLALQSTKLQLQSADSAAKAVRERFNIGFADMTSVVQTYIQSIEAASAYAQSIREFNSAIASLYRYSSRWPSGALPLLKTRVRKLR